MKRREIGIVAATLVILVAVGIGWLMSKSRGADAAASARNLQQWGIALNLCLIDNENQLPSVGGAPIEPEPKSAWYNTLPAYLGQTPLSDLPEGRRPRPGDLSLWMAPGTKPPRIWDPSVFFFNYAMNQALQPDPSLRSFKIYEIDYPGNVVFMTEVDGYEPFATPGTVAYRYGSNSRQPVTNVLFCDGHVAAVSRSRLTDDPASRLAASAEHSVSWFEK